MQLGSTALCLIYDSIVLVFEVCNLTSTSFPFKTRTVLCHFIFGCKGRESQNLGANAEGGGGLYNPKQDAGNSD
jgi:hypothetical protein